MALLTILVLTISVTFINLSMVSNKLLVFCSTSTVALSLVIFMHLTHTIFLLLYVEGIVVTSSSSNLVTQFVDLLGK